MRKFPLLVMASLLIVPMSVPANAQTRQTDEPTDAAPDTPSPVQLTPDQIGQRQTREELSLEAGIDPMARINGRIQNRVQSRLRNRIDRYYDPQANAISPFKVAGDQVRAAAAARR